MMDTVDPQESKEERMRKRMRSFAEAHNAFLDVIERNKPIYPSSIYDALSKVRERCTEELYDYEYVERPRGEYYKEARKNHEEIVSLIDEACTSIRSRIAEVSTSEA